MRHSPRLTLVATGLCLSTQAYAADINLELLHKFENPMTIMTGGNKGMLPAKPPVYLEQDNKLVGTVLSGGGGDFATINQSGLYTFSVAATPDDVNDFDVAVNSLNNDTLAFDTSVVVDSQGTVYGGAKKGLFKWSEALGMQDALAAADLSQINGGEFEIHGIPAIDEDDNIYVAASDRANEFYALLRLDPQGQVFVLVEFGRDEYVQASDDDFVYLKGMSPAALIYSQADKALYGLGHKVETAAGAGDPTTLQDGDVASGTLFKLALEEVKTDGTSTLEVLHTFSLNDSGLIDDHALQTHSLVEDGDWLYGTSQKGVWRFAKLQEKGFAILHTFGSGENGVAADTDGETPTGPLVLASDGNIYGTSIDGGVEGAGVLYRISLSQDDSDTAREQDAYQLLSQFDTLTTESPVGLSAGPVVDQAQTLFGAANGDNVTDTGGVFRFAVKQHALEFTSSTTEITQGESAQLSWESINLSQCVASGDWQGEQQASDSITLTPEQSGELSFVLSCQDTDDKAFVRRLSLMVNPVPQDDSGDQTPDTGNDGDTDTTTPAPTTEQPVEARPEEKSSGGAFGWLSLLMMGAIAMRRRQ